MSEPDDIRVLHVDDQPDLADVSAEMLQRKDDAFAVETATSASEGLDRLEDVNIDCIVSDYDMPGRDGIEFLEAVRESYTDLPFILFTGKGSEEVASEAFSAGATDYLRKSAGADQYELLANRVRNAVEQYRSRKRAAELDRVRTLASDINQALVRADAREDIDARVCEIISESEPYLFAWVGEVDEETDLIEPREWAGVEKGYLDQIVVDTAESSDRQGPGWTAVNEERIGVSQDVATDPDFEPWREAAEPRGYRSVAAVPLLYERHRYGVLGVYAAKPDAFDDDERALLEELGEDIAYAHHSVDVRERLRTERDRREALFENAPTPVLASEMAPDGSSIRITDVNAAFESRFGYDREEIVGRDPADVIVPDEGLDSHESFRDRASAGDPVVREVERLTAEGTRTFVLHVIPAGVDDDGVDRMYAWYTDIAEREEREQELQRYEAYLEESNDIITVLDENGVIQYQSPSTTRILGYEPGALVGENGFDYIHPDDTDEVYETFLDLVDNPEKTVTAECRFPTADDEWRWLEIRGTNHLDHPEINGIVTNNRDITDRKERERQLERQNERLEEFASVVSHDLRSPLTVARGKLELVGEECDSHHLDDATDAIERSQDLIDDLLALAREGNRVSETEPVALGAVTEQCWRTVETAESTLVTDTDRTVAADRNRLKQLLENLVRNAVEHGGPDTTVRVGDTEDGFYVADDGLGIPAADREQVFEAGYSTAEIGNGFGLSIVAEIADAHGWDISVTESDDGGARFEITGVEFEE